MGTRREVATGPHPTSLGGQGVSCGAFMGGQRLTWAGSLCASEERSANNIKYNKSHSSATWHGAVYTLFRQVCAKFSTVSVPYMVDYRKGTNTDGEMPDATVLLPGKERGRHFSDSGLISVEAY